MKTKIFLLLAFAFIISVSWNPADRDPLSKIDPGHFDKTWWNRTPIRLIQTNLPEIEGNMDRDAYVKSILDASANTVLFNTGGIVANYQTKLPFQWKNPNMGKGDLVGDLVKKFHENGIKYIARFDFSKLDSSIAAKKPEWLYVGTNGKNVNYNGEVHACINGGYQQEYVFEILKEAITTYPFDAMLVSQSFFVPDANGKKAAKTLASTVSNANLRNSVEVAGQLRTNRKGVLVPLTEQVKLFIVKAVVENGVSGARVWRTK